MNDTCISHIEDHWKEQTSSSNKLFNHGEYEDALVGYEEALFRAGVLNNNYNDCLRDGIPFLQVYVISCHNMAYTYEELGLYKKAQRMLRKAIYFLLHFEKNKTLNQTEVESELKKASLAYFLFLKRTGLKAVKSDRLYQRLEERFPKQT